MHDPNPQAIRPSRLARQVARLTNAFALHRPCAADRLGGQPGRGVRTAVNTRGVAAAFGPGVPMPAHPRLGHAMSGPYRVWNPNPD